jgi:hypothetical protein
VIGPFVRSQEFRELKIAPVSESPGHPASNLAELRHRLTGKNLDIQPNLKFALVRPDFAHLWPGITIDHQTNIEFSAMISK